MTIHVTADCIALLDGSLVLIERKNEPLGLAMPGGMLDEGETLEETAIRELKEETDLDAKTIKQFRTYSDPDRDPRGQFITTVFVAEVNGTPRAASDARAIRIVNPSGIDDLRDEFAADHYRILKDWSDGLESNQD